MDSCIKHAYEPGVGFCRRCGGSWCGNCLVYSFGPKKPPYCMECAMVAGGVRTSTARPSISRRELKSLQKQAKSEAKAAAKAAKDAPQEPAREEETTAAFTPVEVEARELEASGWESPWFEDREPTLAD